MDVFVSYSSPDRNVADAAVTALESAQIRCWYAPRDVPPASVYGDSIMDALRASRVLVVIVSSHSLRSPQVLREVERGVHHGLVLLPFRIEYVEMRGAFEFFLSIPHWLDAISPPFESHLTRLRAAVSEILKSEIVGGAPAADLPGAPPKPSKSPPPNVPELTPDAWTRSPGGRIRNFFNRLTDDPEG